jgi:hypothetical protein
MKKINRRSALALGVAPASAAMLKPAAAQTAAGIGWKDATPAPGVVVRTHGDAETSSLIPCPGKELHSAYRDRVWTTPRDASRYVGAQPSSLFLTDTGRRPHPSIPGGGAGLA